MEDEPVAVALAGPDGDDVRVERLGFPVVILGEEGDGKDAEVGGGGEDGGGGYGGEEVGDEVLDVLLSLGGSQLCQGLHRFVLDRGTHDLRLARFHQVVPRASGGD